LKLSTCFTKLNVKISFFCSFFRHFINTFIHSITYLAATRFTSFMINYIKCLQVVNRDCRQLCFLAFVFIFLKIAFIILSILIIKFTSQINFTLCSFLNCASLTFSTKLLKETGCIVACDKQNYNNIKYKKIYIGAYILSGVEGLVSNL